MARPATIGDEELLNRLSAIFRDVGYAGASLAALSKATGLKRASLYHRFPEGKEQMAREVLQAAGTWLDANVLAPLRTDAPPRDRVKAMATQLKAFYSGGRQACLLNMLSSSMINEGPFTGEIRSIFGVFIDVLAALVEDAGFARREAKARAERCVALLQGSLVLSRGTGSTKPFRTFLETLPDELLGDK